jgi:TPR repeat protein/thioredoxin-like negative regulator of GroEL
MKIFFPHANLRLLGLFFFFFVYGFAISNFAHASVQAQRYQVGFWEGGAYLDNKTKTLQNCVLTSTDNKRNIIWLVRQTDGLYLGFMNPKLKLRPNSGYKARIRIDAQWAADITFNARSKQLALARIDTLPGARKALRIGREMYVTFPSYKIIAPLANVADALSVLEQCRRTYGPPMAKGTHGAEPDALAARIGAINVGKARLITPAAPQQACDRSAAHPMDPDRVGEGISFDDINPKRAIAACRKAVSQYPREARFHYQLARAYDKAKKQKTALRGYRTAMRMGYPQGYYVLGKAYENGWGVSKNEARALAFYKAAYDAGLVAASVHIGNAFKLGLGGPVDMKMAAAWYGLGARKGYSVAELSLAMLYEAGVGIPKDHKKVVELVRSAALHENPGAMVMMGVFYSKGDGVKTDKKKALDWFRLGYSYGHPGAANLASNLAEELGVGRNLPPIIAEVKKSREMIATDRLEDVDVELLQARPPVVVQPVELPPAAYEPISFTYSGLPKGGQYWLTLATPEQGAGEFMDRKPVGQFATEGTETFMAMSEGTYELRVIKIIPKGRKSILSKTRIAVGGPREISQFILSLMDDLDQALPSEAIAPILRDFAVDAAAAPSPVMIHDFAWAMAGEAQKYFDDALRNQDTATLGIATVLAEAARSLAPDSVEITILAASTLGATPGDFNGKLDAESLLHEALEKNPDSDDLRMTLASIAFQTGGAETALDTLAPLLKDSEALKGDPAVLATLTKMFMDSERYDQGLALIRKLTPEGAKGEPFRFYEAALLSGAGHIDEARAVLATLSHSADKKMAMAATALLKELKS